MKFQKNHYNTIRKSRYLLVVWQSEESLDIMRTNLEDNDFGLVIYLKYKIRLVPQRLYYPPGERWKVILRMIPCCETGVVVNPRWCNGNGSMTSECSLMLENRIPSLNYTVTYDLDRLISRYRIRLITFAYLNTQ